MIRRLGGLSTEQQVDRVYENMRLFYRRYIHRDGITGVTDLIYRVTEHEDIEIAETEYNSRITRKYQLYESRRREKRERDDKPNISKERMLLELRPAQSPKDRL